MNTNSVTQTIPSLANNTAHEALSSVDWKTATWIQGSAHNVSTQFRFDFSLENESVKSANLFVCGLGFYEAYINGQRLGDAVLEPAQSDYENFAYYQSHDARGALLKGKNTIGIWTGPGWYDQNKIWGGLSYGKQGTIAVLRIEYTSGKTQQISTSEAWKQQPSPILSSNIYAGESYDARIEDPTWATPQNKSQNWQLVRPSSALSPELRLQTIPPIRRIESLQAINIQSPLPNTFIYDFGQNFPGWVKLTTTLPKGTEICLRFAEAVYPDGTLNPLSTGVTHTHVIPTHRYVSAGKSKETWEPRFCYHGFRYVEVTGVTCTDSIELEGTVVHSDLKPKGNFTTSSPFLNKVFDTAKWTLRSNLHGQPTDCPNREKCGWLGDAHLVTDLTHYLYHDAAFWKKYMVDIRSSLGKSDGTWDKQPIDPRIPANIAPGKRRCLQARPDWAVATVLIPWNTWLFTGDTQILEDNYSAMVNWLDAMQERLVDDRVKDGFGDWCPPGSIEPLTCEPEFTSTLFVLQATRCMLDINQALRIHDSDTKYRKLETRLATSLHQEFFDEKTGSYGSQTANALALSLNLIPQKHRDIVTQALVDDITIKNSGHFDTGIHGLRYLFEALTDNGREDVAWQLFHQDGYPSFRHHTEMLNATTFWEVFYDPEPHSHLLDRSQNHPMQAAFAAFYFSHIAGIRPLIQEPGFKRFKIKPYFMDKLESMSMSLETQFGFIESNWKRRNNEVEWTFVIPDGTVADVYAPHEDTILFNDNGKAHRIAPHAALAAGKYQSIIKL